MATKAAVFINEFGNKISCEYVNSLNEYGLKFDDNDELEFVSESFVDMIDEISYNGHELIVDGEEYTKNNKQEEGNKMSKYKCIKCEGTISFGTIDKDDNVHTKCLTCGYIETHMQNEKDSN